MTVDIKEIPSALFSEPSFESADSRDLSAANGSSAKDAKSIVYAVKVAELYLLSAALPKIE